MIDVHTNQKGEKYVLASELHNKIGVKSPLRVWFPRMLTYDFEENKDYVKVNIKQKGATGQSKKDWHLNLSCALKVLMLNPNNSILNILASKMKNKELDVLKDLSELTFKIVDKPFFTYVMIDTFNDDVYKIGRTTQPFGRVTSIQSLNPYIEPLFWIKGDIEKDLHDAFKNKNIRRELFKLTSEDVEQIKDMYNIFVTDDVYDYNGKLL